MMLRRRRASNKDCFVPVALNLIQRDTMKQVAISGVPVKGDSPFNTCNRAFGNCLNPGAATRADEDIETNLQKLIPDGLIGRFDLDAPFDSPSNHLDGCETFVEVKTLAALTMNPNVRAQKFQSDVEKRVHDLDSKYPGSTSHKGSSLMARAVDILSWLSAPLQTFLTTLRLYATFSGGHAPSEQYQQLEY